MVKSEILEILKKYQQSNAEKYGIIKLGLFGSYSKNEGNDASDVDIVIEIKEPDLFKLVHIKNDLEILFNKSVDLVRKRKKMNPQLKKYLERDAIYV